MVWTPSPLPAIRLTDVTYSEENFEKFYQTRRIFLYAIYYVSIRLRGKKTTEINRFASVERFSTTPCPPANIATTFDRGDCICSLLKLLSISEQFKIEYSKNLQGKRPYINRTNFTNISYDV